MRNLGNIAGLQRFTPAVRLELTSRDGSTSYVHSADSLLWMSPLEWEVPPGGGLGKPGKYSIRLSLPLEDIQARKTEYSQATAALVVGLNGKEFTPAVGRVREILRDVDDPNLVTLGIADRFLDDDPRVPVEAIVDSFSPMHPEELAVDAGYPLYYGRHHRPTYMTGIFSGLSIMYVPRGISSAQQDADIWWNSDFGAGDATDRSHVIRMGAWFVFSEHPFLQGSGNIRFTSNFTAKEVSSEDIRLYDYTGGTQLISRTVKSELDQILPGGRIAVLLGRKDGGTGLTRFEASFRPRFDFTRLDGIYAQCSFGPGTITDSAGLEIGFGVWSADGTQVTSTIKHSDATQPPYGIGGQTSESLYQGIGNQDGYKAGIYAFVAPANTTRISSEALLTFYFEGRLDPRQYRRYSIYQWPANSAEVAVTANPIGVLVDIFSHHTGTPYLSSQASAAQLAVQSYAVQMFLAERRPLSEVADELGRLCAVHMWPGDSGMIQFRTYQESATATVDRTLTTSDIARGSFRLRDAPLGSTLFEQNLAREVTLEFGYHFQRARYEQRLRAHPGNTALCASADAAGYRQGHVFQTQYLTNPDVASYALGNQVRHHCQAGAFCGFRGGANLFDIEAADVLRVAHPMIDGGADTYQMIHVRMNPLEGWLEATGAKLLSLDA